MFIIFVLGNGIKITLRWILFKDKLSRMMINQVSVSESCKPFEFNNFRGVNKVTGSLCAVLTKTRRRQPLYTFSECFSTYGCVIKLSLSIFMCPSTLHYQAATLYQITTFRYLNFVPFSNCRQQDWIWMNRL